MEKDFDGWNKVKKQLNASRYNFEFNNGEIWWCSEGINIGNEQDGRGKKYRRPVLIYNKINRSLFYGIPFTHTPQEKTNWTEIVKFDDTISYAQLDQLDRMSVKRLLEPIAIIDEKSYDNIIYKVRNYAMNPKTKKNSPLTRWGMRA